MKNLYKPLFPIAGFVVLAATVLKAGDNSSLPATPAGKHHEQRGEMRGDFMAMVKELNLTADQQTQIDAIRSQGRESMKALRNDTSLSQEQKKAKGRELLQASEGEIRDVLTPEQKVKARELRQKHESRGPDKGHRAKAKAN